jgi:hypothetical protein
MLVTHARPRRVNGVRQVTRGVQSQRIGALQQAPTAGSGYLVLARPDQSLLPLLGLSSLLRPVAAPSRIVCLVMPSGRAGRMVVVAARNQHYARLAGNLPTFVVIVAVAISRGPCGERLARNWHAGRGRRGIEERSASSLQGTLEER